MPRSPLMLGSATASICRSMPSTTIAMKTPTAVSQPSRPKESGRVICSRLDALENCRQRLTDTNAHRAKGVASPRVMQLVDRGDHQPRSAGAERVADGDRTSVRVDLFGGVGKSECAGDGERLSGERL